MRLCDQCCAESKVRWNKDGLSLDLCQHHSNQHGPELVASGWVARLPLDKASDLQPGGPLVRRAV